MSSIDNSNLNRDPPLERPPRIPAYSLDTFPLSASRSREIWRSVVDGTFELEGLTGAEQGHKVRTKVWFLEELMLASFEGEANAVHRTRKLVDLNPTPMVKVRVYRSGHSLLIDGDTQMKIGTGAIHFIDHDRPMRQISTDHKQFTISVPYHAIGCDPAVHPACLSIGLDTVRGRLIEAGLSTLLNGIGAVQAAEATALSEAVVGLLRGALAGGLDSQDDRTVRQVRINALKRYIDQNLADPLLGTESLLREFGASRATIYRDFAEEGGLQNYIMERRLQRAFRFLAEASPVRGQVQDVAARCGFGSIAHFSRRFRAGFGIAPSDVVGQWTNPKGSSSLTELDALIGLPQDPTVAALHWAYNRFKSERLLPHRPVRR